MITIFIIAKFYKKGEGDLFNLKYFNKSPRFFLNYQPGTFILGCMKIENHGTWIEINYHALQQNFKVLSKISGRQVMAVVKANAYGHGLIESAKYLEDDGAKWFGVARFEEALALRNAGIKGNILVLGYTLPSITKLALNAGISLTVFDFETAQEYSNIALNHSKRLKLHVKIETGLGRLGILPEMAERFVFFVKDLPGIELEGVFTHFARSDEPQAPDTKIQIEKFEKVIKNLQSEGYRPSLIHASNSAAIFNFPEAGYDLVRCGIALYGMASLRNLALPDDLVPPLSWKTKVVSIKTLPAGHGVSYGGRYYTSKPEKIGALPVGYGDGLRRLSGYQVLIGGKRVNVVGSVCMDQCMVQLNDHPNVKVGDEVVIIGNQGNEAITALDLAEAWGTVTNEVICNLATRMPREYVS